MVTTTSTPGGGEAPNACSEARLWDEVYPNSPIVRDPLFTRDLQRCSQCRMRREHVRSAPSRGAQVLCRDISDA
eukprot:9689911-Alexandrium_andersonii.AAC.1